MLADVPTFLAIDGRNYTLAKEDIVTLPKIHAKNLIDRKVAALISMVVHLG